MPLINQAIKNLKGGISQQPDILRYPDQGREQVNGFSSEVQGLQKRPPSVHVKRLRSTYGSMKPLVKLINRDEAERYYVVYHENPNGIEVFDLNGNAVTVNAPNGWGYMATPNPRDDIRAVTVADYTFIVNRRITVREGGGVAHPAFRKGGEALISVKGGQYGRTYKVFVNGILRAEHTTPIGDAPDHVAQIDTQFIAQKVADKLHESLSTPLGWGVAVGPGYIHLIPPEGQTVDTIKTEDGFNGGNMMAVIFEAQRFNLLPAQAPNGYIVKVNGDPGTGADDYYIQFDANAGLWRETIAPGAVQGMERSTMPHVLVRETNGTFTFRQNDWVYRTAGDDDSNPLPSFVDQRVSDVFFFRNRLGLIAGENIILSRSGDFFSFFPKSVVVSPDTDPIDVAVSHNRVSILNHAVPFAEELLLWSDQTQFVLRSDGVLSPRSVRVDQSTEFESAIAARPVPAGRSVYFAAPRATYTSIRRYYSVQDVSAVKNAEDISAHIPSYIQNGVYYLGSSTTENVVTVLTSGAESRIYLYKYLYMDEQLMQQSWSHWDFGPNNRILACEFVGAVMHIMRSSPEGLYMDRIEFTQNTKDLPNEPFRVFADHKAPCRADYYDEINDRTAFTLQSIYGGNVTHASWYWLVRSDGRTFRVPLVLNNSGAGYVFIKGNHMGRDFTIGEEFEFKYAFSKFLIKVQDQSGTRTDDVGRLQIRRAWVNYEQSGPFDITVCQNFKYTMSGKRLGESVLGESNLDTGQFRFPVGAKSDRCDVVITSSTPTPMAIIGAGWNGLYWRREQAV